MFDRIPVDLGAALSEPKYNGKMVLGYDTADTHPYRPEKIPEYVFHEDSLRPVLFTYSREQTRKSYEERKGLLIMGPKGCGKTTLPEQFLTRIGCPVLSYTANEHSQFMDIAYSKSMVSGDIVYVDGPMCLAMKHGFPIIINEVNLMSPGELAGFNDVIERGMLVRDDGEVIRAERGFFVIFTMNAKPGGDASGSYAGTRVMNGSFISRCLLSEVDYQPEVDELKVLTKRFPQLDPEVAKLFIRVTNEIRSAYMSGTTMEDTMSTRELIAWVELTSAFRQVRSDAPAYALRMAFSAKLEAVSQRVCAEIVQRTFEGR